MEKEKSSRGPYNIQGKNESKGALLAILAGFVVCMGVEDYEIVKSIVLKVCDDIINEEVMDKNEISSDWGAAYINH